MFRHWCLWTQRPTDDLSDPTWRPRAPGRIGLSARGLRRWEQVRWPQPARLRSNNWSACRPCASWW